MVPSTEGNAAALQVEEHHRFDLDWGPYGRASTWTTASARKGDLKYFSIAADGPQFAPHIPLLDIMSLLGSKKGI